MATNLYHHLSFLPGTEAWEMPPPLEGLAQQLVASGKLRINADHERNFVRYGSSNADLTFTLRELTDPKLSAHTRARISRLVAPAAGEQGMAEVWAHLSNEMKKARGVAVEKEMRVARVLVQSTHPAVIQLLISSGTEVFVSYSHNVADLMAVHEWEGHGTNSGMQATEETGTAVYISAGGNPFFEGEQKTYVTDGFPALARMVVIAGQELGHFADLRRSAHGITGRHSTDAHHSQLRANPIAAAARLSDMRQVDVLATAYAAAGLGRLRRVESKLAFYHQRLRFSPPWFFYQTVRLVVLGLFITMCKKNGLLPRIKTLPRMRNGEAIEAYLADMAFNLAPDAEVYRHPDPLVEEAIAVIEAVARVPQQTFKWGTQAVVAAWPGLFSFYNATVITACISAVKSPLIEDIMDLSQRIKIRLWRWVKTKPGYYP